ncbi:hypothetical protein P1X14_16590 [Sphingomonas sp. AOB5]|uniref:hypothetical protein n=1 Tax=Sphingomonas sp. AOB5 TaxID=3034017 RepID=UPI0023F82CE3|nr:hypothetical protein [Sphingomonas sp. AOB5]MDF7776877.1 hypothetical protein [Sphingomonas sp. AOB5]
MALASGKMTVRGGEGGMLHLGVTTAVALIQGGFAMAASGYVRPARIGQGGSDFAKVGDVANCRVFGVAIDGAIGGVTDGLVTTNVQSGFWLAKNSAGVDALSVADIGRYCFIIDDETVAKHSLAGMRPRAGIVWMVSSEGVMVRMGPEIAALPDRVFHLPYDIPATELAAGTPIDLICPISGFIARNTTIVQTAIVTGGDVTVKNDTTDVVGLTNSIADAAAKGSIVTDTPTLGDATTAVVAGQRIQIVPAAAFNGGGAVRGLLEIRY